MLKYVSVAIGQEKGDRDNMICDKLPSIDAQKVEAMAIEELRQVYGNCEQFSCSFIDKSVEADASIDDPVALCGIDHRALQAFYTRTIIGGDEAEEVNHRRMQGLLDTFCDGIDE